MYCAFENIKLNCMIIQIIWLLFKYYSFEPIPELNQKFIYLLNNVTAVYKIRVK